MKIEVTLNDFRDAFNNIRPNNFSYEGLEVLFDWLEQYEIDTGAEVELDVIALCCDFSEMDASEVIANYGLQDDVEDMDDDESELLGFITDYLSGETMLCGLTPQNTFVFQNF